MTVAAGRQGRRLVEGVGEGDQLELRRRHEGRQGASLVGREARRGGGRPRQASASGIDALRCAMKASSASSMAGSSGGSW